MLSEWLSDPAQLFRLERCQLMEGELDKINAKKMQRKSRKT
jgi:hypothetical protein